MQPEARDRLARALGLNRTAGVVLIAVLFFGLGEELWGPFMPVYFRAQAKEAARESAATGAVGWEVLSAVGWYACLRNLFEGFCFIGGGRLTAWLGDRGSLLLFGAVLVGPIHSRDFDGGRSLSATLTVFLSNLPLTSLRNESVTCWPTGVLATR